MDYRASPGSFTGSLPVGIRIQQAGAGRLLRTQLELGGKNALVVLTDRLAAVDAVVVARSAAGQRCSATSRVVVERPVSRSFSTSWPRGSPRSASGGRGPASDICRW